MNKEQLVQETAFKAGVKKKEADAIVSAICECIMEAVAGGEKVTLVGFGSFEPKTRKAREGRNPNTGQPMTIPETIAPSFSAGKGFKQKVAQDFDEEDSDEIVA